MLTLLAAVVESQTPFILFGCALFAAALFIYIFYRPEDVEQGEAKTRLSYLAERKEATYENLRDLNFEYRAGKVPDVDYQQMKNSLQDEAATILAEISRIEAKAAEARAARARG